MRWFFDERLSRKREVVRARPVRLDGGLPGMRIELRFEAGLLSDLNQPLVLPEAAYQKGLSFSTPPTDKQ